MVHQQASSADPVAPRCIGAAFLFGGRVAVDRSNWGSRIRGHCHPVNGQTTAPLLLGRAHAGTFVHAGPSPVSKQTSDFEICGSSFLASPHLAIAEDHVGGVNELRFCGSGLP